MTDLELYRTAASGITSLDDLKKLLRPVPDVVPQVLPSTTKLDSDDRAALERLPKVYGQVVPTEKRDLTEAEVAALFEERQTLDALEKMIKERKEAIRDTVVNAMDCRYEAGPSDEEEPDRDKGGHYVRNGAIRVPDSKQQFSWEASGGKIQVDLDALREVAADPEIPEITHQDFLNMTDQVRVLNVGAFLQEIKDKPELLKVLGQFVSQGAPRGALYIRRAK